MAAQMLGPLVVGIGIPLFHAVLGPLADGIGIPPGPPGDVSPQPVPDFQLRQTQAKGRETPPLATDRVADPPIFLIASPHLDCLEHPAGPPRFLLVSPHDGAVDLGAVAPMAVGAQVAALAACLVAKAPLARHFADVPPGAVDARDARDVDEALQSHKQAVATGGPLPISPFSLCRPIVAAAAVVDHPT